MITLSLFWETCNPQRFSPKTEIFDIKCVAAHFVSSDSPHWFEVVSPRSVGESFSNWELKENALNYRADMCRCGEQGWENQNVLSSVKQWIPQQRQILRHVNCYRWLWGEIGLQFPHTHKDLLKATQGERFLLFIAAIWGIFIDYLQWLKWIHSAFF